MSLASVAAIAAVSVAVSGCGTSTVANVVDPVAQAATISNQTSGMRLNLVMHVTTSALPAPITSSGSGAFNLANHTGSFSLTLDLGSIPQVSALLGTSKFRLDEIQDGATVYLKLPPALARNPALHGKPWAKIDLATAASAAGVPGLSSLMNNPFSTDPSQFLRYLRATSGSITKVGTAIVDGFHTTHYRARIQLARVPNAFPAAQRAEVRQTIAALEQSAHVSSIPIDVWIDGQHLVRREALRISEAAAGQTVGVGLTVDIPEYGPQPTPQLPPASQVTDLTGSVGTGTSSSYSLAG